VVTDERVRQLQSAMGEQDVDATVLLLTENIVLMTGHYIRIPGLGLAVVPREGEAALLVPDFDEERARGSWDGDLRTFTAVVADDAPKGTALSSLQDLLGVGPGVSAHLRDLASEFGARGGRIGFEGSFEQVAPACLPGEPNAVGLPTQQLIRDTFATGTLVDVTEALETMRAVKTEYELEKLRTVHEIALIGFAAFKEHARPGRTEVEIRSAVESAICNEGHGYKGAKVVRAFATVNSGVELRNGWNYFLSRPRVVEKNDLVMVEMATVADGYWSDQTRTVVAGRATDDQRAAYRAVREAMDAAFAAAVPGATGGTADAAARTIIRSTGYDGVYPHQTGHGVGFRYHETRPNLVPGSEDVLETGMVIVAEPAFYTTTLAGGIRQEDAAVVTSQGARPLTSMEFDFED